MGALIVNSCHTLALCLHNNFYTTSPVCRQYYHSHTCLPMLSEEMAADSEAELESIGRWQRTCSQRV